MGSRTGTRVLEDTIIAVATPPGYGGLGIVRISGRRALAVAARIFEPKAGPKKPLPVRRPVFGTIRDPERKTALDEAFLTYFKAPRSYTREDVVELSAHGSPAVLETILRLGTEAGARPARPGEFTLRAHLNGRLDILQAEAVDDLVRSVTLAQARVASNQVAGSLSRRVLKMRERLISLLSRVEAALEFPEDGLRVSAAVEARALAVLCAEVERLVAGYEAGRAIGEGLTLAIAGRTNVGKSTLFNALLEEDRAIVTPFPGTTRDFLREKLLIDGLVFHLVDMAGLGRPAHPVEKRGLARGKKIAGAADGLLLVLDASRREAEADLRLLRTYRDKKLVVVLNKSDLPAAIDKTKVRRLAGANPVLEVSALKGRNLDGLRREISARIAPAAGKEEEIVLHARQRDVLREVLGHLRGAGGTGTNGPGDEVRAEELRAALRLLGELTGEVRVEEVLDQIFGRFCVGK